jgi:hypothetical protein
MARDTGSDTVAVMLGRSKLLDLETIVGAAISLLVARFWGCFASAFFLLGEPGFFFSLTIYLLRHRCC